MVYRDHVFFCKTFLDASLVDVITGRRCLPQTEMEKIKRAEELLTLGADPNGTSLHFTAHVPINEPQDWESLRKTCGGEASMLEVAVVWQHHLLADLLVARGANPNLVVDGVACHRDPSGQWQTASARTA